MISAQEQFRSFLRDNLAPRLRALGFTGSGQNFSIPSETCWALMGIQRSRWSDRKELKFTLNLYVVPREEWENAKKDRSYLSKAPSANTRWPIGWHQRIGSVMPEKKDLWWRFPPATDASRLAAEIAQVVDTYALPEIRKRIEDV
jgi:hypothetical protein